jgi:hypothetical protein
MKQIALLVTCLSVVMGLPSCSTYLKGDLADKHLAPSSANLKRSSSEGKKRESVLHKNGKSYNVTATYNVWGLGGTPGVYVSMLSLGLIPFYSTNNGDVDFSVTQGGKKILSERLNSRFHTIYGWLAILSADGSDNKDLMNFNEGYSMQEQMINELDERLARYLNRKL